ncbi:hypothetical protein HGRIS_011895 [Hohenbuehelia grisea]|uniref:Protein kinase domain-containing protein n=1 Tax=Hohenbuehelia grisea TaxID=104357 RepID=A0ABR3JWN3_9AGAR
MGFEPCCHLHQNASPAQWYWRNPTVMAVDKQSREDTVRSDFRHRYQQSRKLRMGSVIQLYYQVFSLIKTRLNGRSGDQQIYINALYELVKFTQLRELPSEIFFSFRQALLKWTRKVSLLPETLLITFTRSDRGPIETGASAIVYHGYLENTDVEIAEKSYRVYSKTARQAQKNFIKEVAVLSLLSHANVLPFLGIAHEQRTFSVISEWMSRGDAMTYLRAYPNASRRALLEQVADGMDYLQQNNVVHGDLKGSNVLIDSEGKARIADFGLSHFHDASPGPDATNPRTKASQKRHRLLLTELRRRGLPQSFGTALSSALSTMSAAGTTRWMAPERLAPEQFSLTSAAATFESDVFAFGMLGYELYSGHPPFYEHRNPMMAALEVVGGKRPGRPVQMPDAVWTLIEECWQQDAGSRPAIGGVYARLAAMLDSPSDAS